MKQGLTIKQEKFCVEYLKTGSASEAYRATYNASEMKATTINRKAKELMDNGKIAARIGSLREHLAKKADVTLDTIIAMLLEDREFARANKHSSAAVTATMGLAKITGHMVEDRRNDRSPYEDWTEDELDRALAAADKAIAEAQGERTA